MSALVELAQAVRLRRAEDRWLDQCSDRLRKGSPPRSASTTSIEPVETTISTEAVR